MKRLIFSLFLMYVFSMPYNQMSAQVTIGSNIVPSTGALLDIKENASIAPIPNATGGILFPKVALQGRTVLQPVFPPGTPSSQDSLETTGMVVYNVSENAIEEGPGLYVWNGREWYPLKGKSNEGIELTDCSTSSVSGIYIEGVPLNTSTNFIEIEVSITKVGTYSFTATPKSTDNGYHFSSTVEFNQPGKYLVVLEGEGIPLSSTSVPDIFDIKIGGISTGCLVEVSVIETSLNYDIVCESMNVSGNYFINTTLDETNTITLEVSVPNEALNTDYIIETNIVNGIKFSGTGTLTSNTQTITLTGEGTPEKSGLYDFLITTNSINDNSCELSIIVFSDQIRIMGISTGDYYNIENGSGDPQGAMRKLLDNPNNFGPSGICQMKNFYYVNNPDNRNDQYYNPIDSAALSKAINDKQPDIIMVGYAFLGQARAANCLVVLQRFINSGKVVILTGDYTVNVHPFLKTMFGNNVTLQNSGDGATVMPFINDAFPAITNGPFGSLNSLYMQRDAGSNFEIKGFAEDETGGTALVTNNNGARAVVHNTLGLIFIGDGGPFTGSTDQLNNTTAFPLKVNTDNTPGLFPITISGTPYTTANALFFCNVMAWAVQYVTTHSLSYKYIVPTP